MNIPDLIKDVIKSMVVLGLLVLYIGLSYHMFDVAQDLYQECMKKDGCPSSDSSGAKKIIDRWSSNDSNFLISTALLLATVVSAELAVTPSGSAPGRAILGLSVLPEAHFIRILATAYVIIWLLCGGAIFVFGMFFVDDAVRTELPILEQMGSSYWAMILAIGYAYFGVQKPNDSAGGDTGASR